MALLFKILPTMLLLSVASCTTNTSTTVEPPQKKGHFRTYWPAYTFIAIIGTCIAILTYSGVLSVSIEHSKSMVNEFADTVSNTLDLELPLDLPKSVGKGVELSLEDREIYERIIDRFTELTTDLEEFATKITSSVDDQQKASLLERAVRCIDGYTYKLDTFVLGQLVNQDGQNNIDLIEKAKQIFNRSTEVISKIQSIKQGNLLQ